MSADQSFDQWVRDEGGPEAVVAMVEDVKRQADEGLLPGFTNKEAMAAGRRDLASLRTSRRRV